VLEINLDDYVLTPERERSWREAMKKRAAEIIIRDFTEMVAAMDEAEEERLRDLPYCDFLETRYWHVLRRYACLKHGDHCDRCPRTVTLQVHHLIYAHVGSEYRYLEDLTVLCDRCHAAEHGR